jgi:uncharacterized protein (DUF362 family)
MKFVTYTPYRDALRPLFSLEQSTMSELSADLEALAALALPDGGWGYAPNQGAHLEPTCLALLALSREPERFKDVIDGGKAFLLKSAAGDGTYRLERGRDEAVWPTSLVLFTLATLGTPGDELQRSAAVLLGLQGKHTPDEKDQEIHDIDLTIVGWPWADGNFSWAEPTAWACLALRRAGFSKHGRVQEGIRLLVDRALDEGGINYGNRRILGRILEPIPGPTALMLIAVQGKSEHPRVDAAVAYLADKALAGDDLEHLCWAKIALDLYADRPGVRDDLTQIDERIEASRQARAETPYVRPAPLRVALTALALHTEQSNPFRLGDEQTTVLALAPSQRIIKALSLGQRFKSLFQNLAVTAVTQLRSPEPQTAVHIAPVSDYNANLADVVQRQYENFRERVPLKGKRVVLKPNLVEYHREKVINTDPRVVAAVIELCQREGAGEVIVAEGPGHWRNVEYLVAASGLGDVLRTYKVPFVDLNHDEPIKTVNLGRLTKLEHLYLSRTIASAEVVISLPKLKTHHWAVATLSLKNLFGTLPGICYGWPKNELHWRGIDNSIVDIALTRTPDLAIVDGIIGMEGDGPLNGTPKPMGVLVMGSDLVAVDATCCRLMQFDPERVAYLVLGLRKKLGHLAEPRIRQLGETIADRAQPFETVEHFKALALGKPA